jgi:hypothetical protein
LTLGAQEILQHQNPNVQYTWHLIRNTKAGLEADDIAADPHGMKRFVMQGNLLRKHGGLFEFDCDCYSRVTTVYRQTPNNKAYMAAYGDYLSCDGTHLIDMYGNLLILFCVLDCLGKCQSAGSIVTPAESADTIIKGVKMFDCPHGKDNTFHTDGGSWGPVTAEALERLHVLCANHFSTKKVLTQTVTVCDSL